MNRALLVRGFANQAWLGGSGGLPPGCIERNKKKAKSQIADSLQTHQLSSLSPCLPGSNRSAFRAVTKVLGSAMSRSTKAPRRRPASGFYGVTKPTRSNWNARINIIDGQQRLHCGSFGTKEEAALAYDRAAREHRPDLPTNYESIEAAEAAADRAKAEYMRQPKAPRKRPASG